MRWLHWGWWYIFIAFWHKNLLHLPKLLHPTSRRRLFLPFLPHLLVNWPAKLLTPRERRRIATIFPLYDITTIAEPIALHFQCYVTLLQFYEVTFQSCSFHDVTKSFLFVTSQQPMWRHYNSWGHRLQWENTCIQTEQHNLKFLLISDPLFPLCPGQVIETQIRYSGILTNHFFFFCWNWWHQVPLTDNSFKTIT